MNEMNPDKTRKIPVCPYVPHGMHHAHTTLTKDNRMGYGQVEQVTTMLRSPVNVIINTLVILLLNN